jgi:hypothetical protein
MGRQPPPPPPPPIKQTLHPAQTSQPAKFNLQVGVVTQNKFFIIMASFYNQLGL